MACQATGRTIAGDLLSCYTASIAEYMERTSIDHQLALGTQLFFAALPPARPGRYPRFIHYHTPVRGATPTHTLVLHRRGAGQLIDAIAGIGAELRRAPAVIAVGDGYTLPWHIDHQRRHVPHWFIIDNLDECARRLHVVDQFAFIAAQGSQEPFAGWVDWHCLAMLAPLDLAHHELFRGREQHAFGDIDDLSVLDLHGYHWFEAEHPTLMNHPTRQRMIDILLDTCHFHSGARRVAHLPAPWVAGVDALSLVAQLCADQAERLATYDIQDDLWVAGRNRQIFCSTLDRLAGEFDLPMLADVAAWSREEILSAWSTVVQAMEYSKGSLKRGRRASPLPARLLGELAVRERELLQRLRAALTGRRHPDRPASTAPLSPPATPTGPSPPSVPPRTEIERLVGRIWAELLDVEQVSIHDSFLQLGGNSLRAVQLVSRLRDVFALELPLLLLPQIPTVAELAAMIETVRWIAEPDAPLPTPDEEREEISL